jgi:hypothetical protein
VTWLADWAALTRLTRNGNKLFLLITTSVDALVPLRANPLPRTQRPAEGGNRPLVGRHNIREAARPTRSRAAFLPVGITFPAASFGRRPCDQLSTILATSFEPIIQRSVGRFSKVAFKAALAAQPGKITCPRSGDDKPTRLDLAVLDDF